MYRFARVSLMNTKDCQKRNLWAWVNMMFNRPDESRIRLVGPDRACAEWLLRNGGAVRWTGQVNALKDYNSLPGEKTQHFIEEVDASNSSISHYGFPHFRGCMHITKITLHKCSYIENEAIKGLSYVESPLTDLEISNCNNVTDSALLNLPMLKNLKNLKLINLQSVKDLSMCIEKLKERFPNCKITDNMKGFI